MNSTVKRLLSAETALGLVLGAAASSAWWYHKTTLHEEVQKSWAGMEAVSNAPIVPLSTLNQAETKKLDQRVCIVEAPELDLAKIITVPENFRCSPEMRGLIRIQPETMAAHWQPTPGDTNAVILMMRGAIEGK